MSIIQLTLLPGLIITRLFRIKGFWENLLFAFGLSPIFNHFLVIFATLGGFYNQIFILVLFSIESLLLIILLWPVLRNPLGKNLHSNSIKSFFDQYLSHNQGFSELKKKNFNGLYIAFFLLSILSLIIYFFLYATKPTQIFTGWDAVISWDKWAVEWFQGMIPTLTWHYPQLIPTNLSIPYQFIGTPDVKYFSKYFANLIELALLLTVFILGIRRHKIGYFIGTAFTAWLMFAFGSRGSGYADTPVAFWGLLAVSCLILAQGNPDKNKLLIFGAVFAAGSAITKQAGLWIAVTYPLLILLSKSENGFKKVKTFLISILIIIIMVAPWYIFKEIQIQRGLEVSEIEYVTSLVLKGRTPLEIFRSAMDLFIATLQNRFIDGTPTLYLLILLVVFSYKDKVWAKITSIITIPFTIGWIFFFSYENRNVDLIIPLLAITAGVGLEKVLEIEVTDVKRILLKVFPENARRRLKNTLNNLLKFLLTMKGWYLLFFIPFIFLLPLKITDSRLLNNSFIKQSTVGEPTLNEKLYSFYRENGFNGKIITEYQYLGFLPDIKEYYEYNRSSDDSFFIEFNDPQVGYALINDHWCSEQVLKFVKHLIDQDKILLIFEEKTDNGHYYFVTTCKGVCD